MNDRVSRVRSLQTNLFHPSLAEYIPVQGRRGATLYRTVAMGGLGSLCLSGVLSLREWAGPKTRDALVGVFFRFLYCVFLYAICFLQCPCA